MDSKEGAQKYKIPYFPSGENYDLLSCGFPDN